ncbi:hypothetical protein B0H12DRAFT_1067979 [Mycena haematopus]|nr:hypothetical protein B0H12DRAFT_1067979 [Mycena haematopus]
MAPQEFERSVDANHRAATSGMGVHSTSPLKARDKRKEASVLASATSGSAPALVLTPGQGIEVGGACFHLLCPPHLLCLLHLPAVPSAPALTSARTSAASATSASASAPVFTPGQADQILRERYPACFGHTEWGRSFLDGGNVQFGTDGCFSYRHLQPAGDVNLADHEDIEWVWSRMRRMVPVRGANRMAAAMRRFDGAEVHEGDLQALGDLFANHVRTLLITWKTQ